MSVRSNGRKADVSNFGRNRFLYETLHLGLTLPWKNKFLAEVGLVQPMAKFAQRLARDIVVAFGTPSSACCLLQLATLGSSSDWETSLLGMGEGADFLHDGS